MATSLATSIVTSAGTWAVVPMGLLDQPLNTFWQLFFRPTGASRWSDEASALAVATNGGLLVATPNGESLVVGIRPANLLDYSPLLVTTDAGRTWLAVPPLSPLAKQPDALATGPGGHALALVNAHQGGEVLESTGGLSDWHELTTASELAASPAGRSCGLVAMTAVGFVAGQALIGASCRLPGTVGMYAHRSGAWRLVGPALSGASDKASVKVLGLQPTTDGLYALLGLSTPHGTSLFAAWTNGAAVQWHVSRVHPLAVSQQALSFGTAGPRGLFVLTSGPEGLSTLLVLTGPGEPWSTLPSPPAGTSTVVFGAAGKVDALAVHDTSFTDWRLASSSRRWAKEQAVRVAIQLGSSS